MPRLLVVDDEPGVRESLRLLFEDACQVLVADSVDAALESIDASPPDAILLDLVMPGRSGLQLLRELAGRPLRPPTVVVSASHSVERAVEAMRLGAVDYVTKPFEVEALRLKVARLLERGALEAELARLRDEVDGRSRLGRLLGRAPAMRELFRTIERLAASRATVLVLGESGTGKELVARAMHELGPRRDGPFVAVNCAALPDALIESELFGHERGAFTDARERRIGRLEAASGGTFFLDEVGELSPAVQAKLLRALQERAVERIGSTVPVPVEVRVVAATHRDLERDVAGGRFREDLYYRLAVVPVRVPPLRERREDVRLLAEAFLARARAEGHAGAPRLTARALAALERHSWPGNVRELENALERAMALARGPAIDVADLPEAVVRSDRQETMRAAVWEGRLTLEEAAAGFERELIREALERCQGNQTHAAARLGLTRRLLKIKMDRYGLSTGAAAAETPGGPEPLEL